jgi:hypothetical protein
LWSPRESELRRDIISYGYNVEGVEDGGFVDVVFTAPAGGSLNPDEAEELGCWLEEIADEVRARRKELALATTVGSDDTPTIS